MKTTPRNSAARRSAALGASVLCALVFTQAPAMGQEVVASDVVKRTGEDAVEPAQDAHAPGAQDLTGTWVYLEQVTTVSDLTVIGETYSTIRAVALYNLEQKGQRLGGAGTMCSLNMKTDSRVISTTLPPAFTRVVQAPPLAIELSHKGTRTLATQKRQYRVLGAKLNKPATDVLPSRRDDSRVFDQDRDGQPGVTVVVSGIVDGEIHLVQRQWNELSGEVVDNRRIEGNIRFGKEEAVLGTTNSVLSDPPVAKPVYRKSFFKLVRLPEGATCAQVRKAFGRYM